ncbi:MAG: UvrD-helicase domain-containing protein [Burkholderiales bacterium]|nr:UvrD-helicase domain-containing protein [Burkholderiales bacterium]
MNNTLHPLQQISFNHANQAYVVEASAGTGKTWTIERLYIKALLESSQPYDVSLPLSVENILVVTFTNDATNELKQRIATQIQTTINALIVMNKQGLDIGEDIFLAYLATRAELFEKDVTLLSRALQNFDQSAIYTIHGFCKRIIEDYQFECKTPSQFELVANKGRLIENLVVDFMRSEIINNPQFKDCIAEVLSNLEQLFNSSDFQQSLVEKISAKLPKDMFELLDNGYQLKYNLSNVPASLALLSQSELSEEDKRQAKAQFLAYLMQHLAAKFPAVNELSGVLSYDDLIQKVADSLKANLIDTDSSSSNILADKIYQQFPVAFIDEFQDTDSLQWQIFNQIYHLQQSTRRGNVVVVGDPKQAIYRFRGADIDTYLAARSQIGTKLELKHNFRSHPEIMNFVNQLFSLDNQNCTSETSFLGSGIDYSEVVAAASNNELYLPERHELNTLARDNSINVEFSDAPVQLVAINGVSADERRKRLLMAISFEILALLKLNPELKGKIAILVSKNSEANELVKFLAKYGLKAAELKLGNIFATSSALDLYHILLAISDLNNRKNFMRALSTQLLNLDLASLNLESNPDNNLFELLQQQFFTYKEIWERQGIISLVYHLIQDVIANHSSTSAIVSHRELANIWQLAELLNKQASKLHNQAELLYWFLHKTHDAQSNLESDLDGNNEELVRLDNDDEQIIITTQHKAKGLEYEILFCPFFKSGIKLDGTYDFNYRRPFFSNFRDENGMRSELIMDTMLGTQIIANDNKEAHRLNYVALTRAKQRLYIYLKQPTITKSTGKYNSNQRPDKIGELFGYVEKDPQDNSHNLFSYANFFAEDPSLALKQPALLPGVAVYNRNSLREEDLQALKFTAPPRTASANEFYTMYAEFNAQRCYTRQSYTALTTHGAEDFDISDYFVKNEAQQIATPNYRYSILSDGQLRGASFGVLFHSLCEAYPFSPTQLQQLLQQENLSADDEHDYPAQFSAMLEETFSYPLIDDLCLRDLRERSLHELEFNLLIKDSHSLREQIADLLARYYGDTHPFTRSCRMLDKVEAGFLVGFIDLFFEYQGKYWILDYKTNTLTDYTHAKNHLAIESQLVESMADHHYYLQYLLYLVAVKRYLEQRLGLADATELLGGAVYFYVRGIFTEQLSSGDGIYLDTGCQNLVRELDLLFRGVSNAE